MRPAAEIIRLLYPNTKFPSTKASHLRRKDRRAQRQQRRRDWIAIQEQRHPRKVVHYVSDSAMTLRDDDTEYYPIEVTEPAYGELFEQKYRSEINRYPDTIRNRNPLPLPD